MSLGEGACGQRDGRRGQASGLARTGTRGPVSFSGPRLVVATLAPIPLSEPQSTGFLVSGTSFPQHEAEPPHAAAHPGHRTRG